MKHYGLRLTRRSMPEYGDMGIFEDLVKFVEHQDHNGLYVAMFGINNKLLLRIYESILMGKLDKKSAQLMEKYRNKPLGSVKFDDLNRHSDRGDGAIVIDGSTNVINDHMAGRFIFPELVDDTARTGTGHASMATLSLFPLVTTYVCSAEKRRVREFRRGHLVKSYDKK